jgi:hypothetical protein
MWASGHRADSVKRAAHGYEATREAAMAAFAKSWRRAISGPRFVKQKRQGEKSPTNVASGAKSYAG